jgi:hypothetical protein
MDRPLNILYIDSGPVYDQTSNSGIERKKLAQINELKKIGNVTRLNYDLEVKSDFFKKFLRRVPFFLNSIFYTNLEEYITDVNIVYFRRNLIDGYVIRLLERIKNKNTNSLIFLELPTYPYDNELSGLPNFPLLVKEKWNRRKLYKYVDRVVLVSSRENIVFRMSTITTINGIDFNSIKVRKIQSSKPNEIHTIIVGNFTFYHGIDRIINGIINYYTIKENKKNKIHVHIIGSGKDINSHKERCKKAKVEEYVHFYGSLSFKEVNEIYDKVSIGINSLGRHRIRGLKIDASIKSHEYGAKGLPVVTEEGIPIDYIPKDYPYVLTVPADDSPLDFNSIVNFHNRIYENSDPQEVALRIREIAENKCGAEEMMRPVLDYYREYVKEVNDESICLSAT